MTETMKHNAVLNPYKTGQFKTVFTSNPFKNVRVHPVVRGIAELIGSVAVTLTFCAAVFAIPIFIGLSPYYCDEFVNTPGIIGKIEVLSDGILDKNGGGKATVTIDDKTYAYYFDADGNLLSCDNRSDKSDEVCELFGVL